MKNPARIETLKDKNAKDGLYKLAEKMLWVLIIEVLLMSIPLIQLVVDNQLDVYEFWTQICIILSFFCLLLNVYYYHSYIIKLLDESNLDRWLSFGLGVLMFALILVNFWNNNLWLLILGLVALCIWFKNNRVYKNLSKIERAVSKVKTGSEIEHPLKEMFFRWSRFSLGYGCFAICSGIILFFFLSISMDNLYKILEKLKEILKDSDVALKSLENAKAIVIALEQRFKVQKLIATAISSGCIIFVFIKNCFGLFRGDTIQKYEQKMDSFLTLREQTNINK